MAPTKALIFAAGLGERMRPLTDSTPKPLLEVAGRALIDYHLQALKRAGVDEVVINISHLYQQIQAHVGDGSSFGLRVHYSLEADGPLETGGGMLQALQYLGTESFIAINGDVYCPLDLAPLMARAQALQGNGNLAHLLLIDNPQHNPSGDFAFRDGKAYSCIANAQNSCDLTERLTFSGIGAYHPKLLAGLKPGKFKLAPILREAMNFGWVGAEHFRGLWVDVGTPARLQSLDAEIRGAEIRGPQICDAKIRDAQIRDAQIRGKS